jgi:hypothetical protein
MTRFFSSVRRINRLRKSAPQDDDTIESGSQRSADMFDSDENEDGDPFSTMTEQRRGRN